MAGIRWRSGRFLDDRSCGRGTESAERISSCAGTRLGLAAQYPRPRRSLALALEVQDDRPVCAFRSGQVRLAWIPGANSWVIPTAFSLIALKQSAACNHS